MDLRKIKKIPSYCLARFMGACFAKYVYVSYLRPKVRFFPRHNLEKKFISDIVHINTLGHQGGAAKIASSLNRGLNKQDYNSRMLVDMGVAPKENIEPLPRDRSIKQKLLWPAQQNLAWLDFFHMSSFQIKDTDVFKNCDILHLHNLHGDYFSLFALPELTSLKPTVWTLHDMQAFTGHCAHSFECDKWIKGCDGCPNLTIYPAIKKDTTNFLWYNKKEIFNHSNFKIACPSNWLKNKIEQSILNKHDIKVIYNGIDTGVFKPTDKIVARRNLGLPMDKKILLFSADGGVDNPFKGSRYLYEVYEKLKHREDVLFLNVGGTKSENKQPNWLNVSYISDEKSLALYYSAADIFIYPSLAETFGLVIAEAFSCETPVVSFDVSAIPELVRHLDNGYLARHRDADDLLKGVTVFLDNPEFMVKAGRKARSLVLSNFTVEKMTKDYVELYHEALDNF